MPSIYRISRPGREPITDVDSVEAVEAAVRAGGPGCHHVDEISAEPLPSGHTSRRWGTAIKRPDGVVNLDPDHGRCDEGPLLRPHQNGGVGSPAVFATPPCAWTSSPRWLTGK